VALPVELQFGIDRELEHANRSRLARAVEQITNDYKQGRFAESLNSPESRTAYLLTRLPATFAANVRVFREVARLMPELPPESMLDLGAGPGTATWAAREVWPELRNTTFIESNREFLELGQRLASGLQNNWIEADLSSTEFPAADLVVLSYAIGELKDSVPVVNRAWHAARRMLVVIEPGTPRNFAIVSEIRRQLIEAGGHPVAPCPHSNECPMAAAGDWCHFAVRVERTSEHRRLKGGTLGYEDEKFSYLAFSKAPAPHADARIVRHPEIHGGHIKLTLCTPEGLQSTTVTRSQKALFRAARKAEWGDDSSHKGNDGGSR
jgi:ribosomal protein RSM22 (predicted rRNA methylase)